MIKVADVSGSNKRLRPIRRIIVNNIEKYRAVVGNNTLVYAKGKINLNYNNSFKDSNDISHVILDSYSGISKLPTALYAFYNDGFYLQDTLFVDPAYNIDRFNKYNYQTLSGIITGLIPASHYAPITFVGWYLSPTPVSGERKINTIADIYNYTTLFNMSTSNSLPTITLYARWNIPKFTLRVHNITRKGTRSSCFYNGQQTDSSLVATFSLLYKTDAIAYTRGEITLFNYRTWGYNRIDYNANLWSGPQTFLGFDTSDTTNGDGCDIYTKLPIIENIDLYPKFNMIAIWEKATLNGITYGNRYRVYTPERINVWTGHANDGSEGYGYSPIDVVLTIDHNNAPPLPSQYQDDYGRWHNFSWIQRLEYPAQYTFETDSGTNRWLSPSGTVVFKLTETVSY